MRILFVFICVFMCFLLASCSEPQKPYIWQLPKDFPLPDVPENNPMTEAKVSLGRHLFYDKKLSGNGKQSCASCHQQDRAFAEMIPLSVGSTGELHHRNSQALVNVAYNKTLTWAHSEITTLEQQIVLPLFDEAPLEMGVTGNEQTVLARFNTPLYNELFEQAFNTEEANFDLIVKALASFVRSLVSFESRFDLYAYSMQDDALNESEILGMDLFFSERLECHHCHGGFNFTQSTTHKDQLLDRHAFHNTGLYNIDGKGAYPIHDQGLKAVTEIPQDMGKFRAPTLRNIALTAPYMHDGSLFTLEQVIDSYAAAGRNINEGEYLGDGRTNPYKSAFIKGFQLTEQEKQDLIAFLHTLTDENFIKNEQFSDPFKR
jgi:cytochrome c peroxidase